MSKTVAFIWLLVVSNAAFSQQKYEKELRIQKSQTPKNAVRFVDSMKLDTKIKWYKELGYNKISYEAKTKYNKERLSIEFSEQGAFEDLEIEIARGAIPSAIDTRITDFLNSAHPKCKIKKIQIQYSGKEKSVLDHFLSERRAGDLMVHYEIVISTKVNGSYTLFESLFDEEGNFVRRSEILLKMTDNIEY